MRMAIGKYTESAQFATAAARRGARPGNRASLKTCALFDFKRWRERERVLTFCQQITQVKWLFKNITGVTPPYYLFCPEMGRIKEWMHA
jgi:hypothetical protein